MARLVRWIGRALLASSGLTLVIASASHFWAADPGAARGGLELDAPVKSFGEVDSGKEVTVPFVFTNRSDRPLNVLGARMICLRLACLDAPGLPIEIPARGSRTIRVRIKARDRGGDFVGDLILYTDQADQPTISTKVTGRVVEGPDAT